MGKKKPSKHLGKPVSSPEMLELFVVVQYAAPLAKGALGGSHHAIYLQDLKPQQLQLHSLLEDRGDASKCNVNTQVRCVSVRYHPQRYFSWNE